MTSTQFANACLDQWQKTLLLQAWDISVVWVEAATIGQDDTVDFVGTIHADARRYDAVLTVALDREPNQVSQTILHELLHLLLHEWKPTLQTAQSYVPAALYTHLGEDREAAEERAVSLLERVVWAAILHEHETGNVVLPDVN